VALADLFRCSRANDSDFVSRCHERRAYGSSIYVGARRANGSTKDALRRQNIRNPELVSAYEENTRVLEEHLLDPDVDEQEKVLRAPFPRTEPRNERQELANTGTKSSRANSSRRSC
jgi:hypothetical protein